MANQYDKILKENIEQTFLPLLEKYLGIKILETKDLPEKLQTTLEREPDFIKVIRPDKGEEFILQMEFQTNDERKMVLRMAEYKAILMRKFEMAVKQYVIYLGTKQQKMRTKLREDEIIKGFELVNIHELGAEKILKSDIPEEIILAILGEYPRTKAGEIIKKIIERLRDLCNEEIKLQKYIQQLTVLSRLRNLELETKKQVEDMPITYDITKDGLFLEGVKAGEKRGEKLGADRALKSVITEMLQDPTMTVEKIARFTKVSPEYVRKIREQFGI